MKKAVETADTVDTVNTGLKPGVNETCCWIGTTVAASGEVLVEAVHPNRLRH
jgi:hypothetical protein